MKKLIAVAAALIILAPAFALAEQGPGENSGPGGFRADVRAELHASTTNSNRGPGGFPKLGPAIHDLASTTRAEFRELRGMGSTTREFIKRKVDAIHDLIEKHKEAMHERAEAAREKAHEHFGERIEGFVGKISDRLASTSQHLADLADRLDNKIDEFKGQGFAMSSSTTLLATAQTDIANANVKITAVNTALANAMSVGTTTAKAEIPAVRTAVKAAEDALRLAKEDLIKTLGAVKVESGATTTTTI
jgi:hypothetical protein